MNLFLVTSPFQYICANEARIEYNVKDAVLVLVEQSRETGKIQMAKILKEDDWSEVIIIPRTARTKNIPAVIKHIKSKYSQFNTYFYSEYDSWRTQLIAKNIPFEKHVYFDDGTMTIIEYEDLFKTKTPYKRKRLLQDIQLRLRGVIPTGVMPFPSNFELFSIFDFKDVDFTYEVNSLSNIRSFFSNYSPFMDIAPAGFIGHAMISERGGMTLNSYLEIIQRYITITGCSQLLYFPHRSESVNQHVVQEIKKIKGLVYHTSEFPLEIEFPDKKVQLSSLGGLTSTALYTLSLMYPDLPIYNALQKKNDYEIGQDKLYYSAQRLNAYYRDTGFIVF